MVILPGGEQANEVRELGGCLQRLALAQLAQLAAACLGKSIADSLPAHRHARLIQADVSVHLLYRVAGAIGGSALLVEAAVVLAWHTSQLSCCRVWS